MAAGPALLLMATILTATDDIARIEQAALDARRAITNCHVVARLRAKYGVTPTEVRQEVDKRLEFWADGDKIRVDTHFKDGVRMTFGRNWPKPGHSVAYRRNSVVDIVPNGGSSNTVGRLYYLFHPRQLGYCKDEMINQAKYGLENDVGSPQRRDIRAERSTLNGEDAWLISSKWIASGCDHKIWILPGKGYNVGRIEASGKASDGKLFSYWMESELAPDPVSGVWYIRRYTHHRVTDGVAGIQESLEIVQSEINQGVDPQVFTLAALDAPAGTPVLSESSKKSERYWDGKQTVSKPPGKGSIVISDAPTPRPVEPLPETGIRWWYVVTAVAFSSAAVLLIRHAIVRRR